MKMTVHNPASSMGVHIDSSLFTVLISICSKVAENSSFLMMSRGSFIEHQQHRLNK